MKPMKKTSAEKAALDNYCARKWKLGYTFTDDELLSAIEHCNQRLSQQGLYCLDCSMAERVRRSTKPWGSGCPIGDAITIEYGIEDLEDAPQATSKWLAACVKHLTVDGLYMDLVKVKELTNKEGGDNVSNSNDDDSD